MRWSSATVMARINVSAWQRQRSAPHLSSFHDKEEHILVNCAHEVDERRKHVRQVWSRVDSCYELEELRCCSASANAHRQWARTTKAHHDRAEECGCLAPRQTPAKLGSNPEGAAAKEGRDVGGLEIILKHVFEHGLSVEARGHAG